MWKFFEWMVFSLSAFFLTIAFFSGLAWIAHHLSQ